MPLLDMRWTSQYLPKTIMANEGHANVKRQFRVTLNERTLNAYSLHVNIEFVDSFFFCQKSCQLLSYKSDTCTCFFFQSVLLQPLDANKAASNSCKRTLWKKNLYGIYYFLPSFNSFRIISNFLPPFNNLRIISNFLLPLTTY